MYNKTKCNIFMNEIGKYSLFLNLITLNYNLLLKMYESIATLINIPFNSIYLFHLLFSYYSLITLRY